MSPRDKLTFVFTLREAEEVRASVRSFVECLTEHVEHHKLDRKAKSELKALQSALKHINDVILGDVRFDSHPKGDVGLSKSPSWSEARDV